ncbi:MAG: hypothetical protein H0X25_20500 [Acidobacteriales bacterium]|nr:hypothetical protein [Terriglobales bacterium]
MQDEQQQDDRDGHDEKNEGTGSVLRKGDGGEDSKCNGCELDPDEQVAAAGEAGLVCEDCGTSATVLCGCDAGR